MLTKNYDQFSHHYECLFIKLNKLTLDLYYTRLDLNDNLILFNDKKYSII